MPWMKGRRAFHEPENPRSVDPCGRSLPTTLTPSIMELQIENRASYTQEWVMVRR